MLVSVLMLYDCGEDNADTHVHDDEVVMAVVQVLDDDCSEHDGFAHYGPKTFPTILKAMKEANTVVVQDHPR